MAQEVYVANETFACEISGENIVVHKGITRVRAGHPLYDAHSGAFDRVGDDVTYDVEEATAPPTPAPAPVAAPAAKHTSSSKPNK